MITTIKVFEELTTLSNWTASTTTLQHKELVLISVSTYELDKLFYISSSTMASIKTLEHISCEAKSYLDTQNNLMCYDNGTS